jgi:hypothetical protein
MAAPPTGRLFYDGFSKPLATNGLVIPGATRNFYVTGTLTPAPVYRDAFLQTPYGVAPFNQIGADGNGRFLPIYLDPNVTYRSQLLSANGTLLEDVDPWSPSNLFIGSFVATTVGFVTNFQVTVIYAVLWNKLVHAFIPAIGVTGPQTSNAAQFRLTGVPAVAYPQVAPYTTSTQEQLIIATDNGSLATLCEAQLDPVNFPNQYVFEKNASQNGWTASGLKGTGLFTFTYWIAP